MRRAVGHYPRIERYFIGHHRTDPLFPNEPIFYINRREVRAFGCPPRLILGTSFNRDAFLVVRLDMPGWIKALVRYEVRVMLKKLLYILEVLELARTPLNVEPDWCDVKWRKINGYHGRFEEDHTH